MADGTGIEWADATFNPWEGCTRVSPACDHCYAEARARRFGNGRLWQGERRRTSAANWRQPLKWDREARASGVRKRVFCASLADVFDNQVDPEWRLELWVLIARCRNLDWLLLTKRPQNILKMLPAGPGFEMMVGEPWPWSHVWLGTTAENQEEADRRIPVLLDAPAAKHFVSAEPLLGPIAIGPWLHDSDCDLQEHGAAGICTCCEPREVRIDWVIVGGESGPGARPMHPDWPRALRDQCQTAGVPFFYKQHGEFIGTPDLRRLPGGTGPGFGVYDHCAYDMDHEAVRVGKKPAGRSLDGREWNEFPA